MKRIVLSLFALVGLSSPAMAMSHNGAPLGASWLQLLWIEIECLFETSLFALQLLMRGDWLMLANLEGVCSTTVNSVLFSNPNTAVFTALVLTILTLMFAFWALIKLARLLTGMPAHLSQVA
jgi:hypothetical protein